MSPLRVALLEKDQRGRGEDSGSCRADGRGIVYCTPNSSVLATCFQMSNMQVKNRQLHLGAMSKRRADQMYRLRYSRL